MNPMNWSAIRASLLLSLLFLVVYGGCNWITSLRSNVGSFHLQWEQHIPFLPLMIVSYMSIDLFFIAAPFLCRDDTERRVLSNRIVAAILIAGVCFLLFPLRFGFARPVVDGILGLIFNTFQNLDKPFNEFPSLHIALRTILAVLYVAHTRGLLRLVTRIWFSLIGFSTLFTYQHHLIDIIGGFALGVICIHLWDRHPLRLPVSQNRRMAIAYSAGAVMLILLALVGRPIGLLLLWPAISFGLTATAYLWLGPGIFRKRNGRLPVTTRLLLWPVLLGQHLSHKYYARQCNAWDRLTDRLWIGRMLSAGEAQSAIDQGVDAVLDLTGEFSQNTPFRTQVRYCSLPIMDLTAPTADQFAQALEFIHHATQHGIVYVHCKSGYSRTAAVAGAYLLSTGRAVTVDEAVALLRASRPRIVVRPEVRQALRQFQPVHQTV